LFSDQKKRQSFDWRCGIINQKASYENGCPSPDGSGKPFEIKKMFFLNKKSDQRKLLFVLRKTPFL
jgi:hypothetical protein